ncbi:MAG: hypothetical protein JNK82_08115 [Myxococcaceae bacterium]|nr:hypothetical protein [Myxococcaceae bacterium]
MTAHTVALTSAGCFFLTGLVTGAWKYACIARSPDAKAPAYVDIAHRASLLYAFACALIATFAAQSAFSDRVNLVAAVVLITYFAVSVLGYLVHGALRDTDNQLARPHRLGAGTIPAFAMSAFMVSLIAAEIGAFTIVFAGWCLR